MSLTNKEENKNPGASSNPEYNETVVWINRSAKVVKGGRRFGFSALIVVGDKRGTAGMGTGKAKELPEAIRKGTEAAYKNLFKVPLRGSTIPHEIIEKCKGGKVLLKPASPGTGIVAGASARAVLEAVGVADILTKSFGSNNPRSVVNATLKALKRLRSFEQIAKTRRCIV